MTPSTCNQADRPLVRSALLAAAEIGPYFRLELLERGLVPGWQPAREFFGAGLPDPMASTARRLGTDETRVAASILHLGFAARLWSPVLGCALLAGVVLDLTSLVVSMEPSTRLGLIDPAGWSADSTAELADLTTATVRAPLAGLASALPVALPGRLLRGNSASAMTGALGEFGRARPYLGQSAAALAAALLRTPGLAGTGQLTGSGLAFRRRSCCLYYRVPGGGLCGDCCLDRRPSARR